MGIFSRLFAPRTLQESEDRFRLLAESVFDGLVVHEAGRILYVNTQMSEIFGYEPDELVKMQIVDLVAPEFRPVALNNYNSRGPIHVEVKGMRKDGSRIDIEVRSRAMTFQGRTIRVGSIRDITEQNLAKAAYVEATNRFAQLTENINEVFWLTTVSKAEMIYISPGYERIFGRSQRSLYENPMSFMEAIHPEDREWLGERVARQAENAYDVEYRVVRPDGSIRWIRDRAFPIRNAEGQIYRVGGIAEDITEQKNTRLRLEESEKRLKLALDANQIVIMELDTKSGRLKLTENYAQIFDTRTDVFDGTLESFWELVHPDDRSRLKDEMSQALATQRYPYTEFRVLSRTGETRWVGGRAHWILDTNGKPERLVGVGLEITDRKRADRLIAESRTQMLAASKMSALGEMAGGIAHEINNPLAIIHGRAGQLKELAEAESLDRMAVARTAERIESTAYRISKIVRSLKNFARDAEGDPFKATSVRTILEDTLAFCQERLANHGIQVIVDEVPETLHVECRSVQISQVLLNLLNNAHDAIENHPVRWVRIATHDTGNSVEISVTDSGNGIAPELQERILDPFFTTKEVGKGTGLGLSVSKGIIENHRGSLVLDKNAPNTRFVIGLPKSQSR